MNYIFIMCFTCFFSVLLSAADSYKDISFDKLNHDQLTKLWQQNYYRYSFFKGKCLNCDEDKNIIGQIGCFNFGEPDGLCGSCLIQILQDKIPFSTYYYDVTFDDIQEIKSKNYIPPAHHILSDNTLHLCILTISGLEEFFLNNKKIPEEWLDDVSKIQKIFNDYEDERKQRDIVKSLPFLCKSCNKFKVDELYQQIFTKGDRWFVSCPGCSYFISLLTVNCSIFHCPNCKKADVAVSTCAYCFQINVNNEIKRHGYRPKENHQCPSSCAEYFHGNIKDNRLSADELICKCEK